MENELCVELKSGEGNIARQGLVCLSSKERPRYLGIEQAGVGSPWGEGGQKG